MNRFNQPAIGNVTVSYRNEEPKKPPSSTLDDILSPTNNMSKNKQSMKPTNAPSNHDDLDDLDDFLGNIGPKTINK